MGRRIDRDRTVGKRSKEHYILILCEGEKTEPNYFKSFAINKEIAELKVDGQGYNSLSLINQSIREKEKGFTKYIPFNEVYAVFDKDSFEPDDFNRAIFLAQKNKIHPIWTNEAFELWYMLHFKMDRAGHNRKDYETYLNRENEILGGYRKNMPNIRSLIKHREDVAIRNAEVLLKESEEALGDKFSQRNPCTLVHTLVKRLRKLEQ